jgi:hypothetical protein
MTHYQGQKYYLKFSAAVTKPPPISEPPPTLTIMANGEQAGELPITHTEFMEYILPYYASREDVEILFENNAVGNATILLDRLGLEKAPVTKEKNISTSREITSDVETVVCQTTVKGIDFDRLSEDKDTSDERDAGAVCRSQRA